MTKLAVAIRVRPLSRREIEAKSFSILSVENDKTVALTNIKVPEQNAGDSRERIRRFSFDYCFNYTSTQKEVYRKIEEEITKNLRTRMHSCILAYGQSASGKTHTMIGDTAAAAAAEDDDDDDNDGIVPRLCQNLFTYLMASAVGSELQDITATVSFLEIYNEKVRDLLNPELQSAFTLKVREHPKTGPYVQGLQEHTVTDASALLALLHTGNANRTIGATAANSRSSRSHSVLTITCLGGLKLRFVDLAGSERAGTFTTSRFREGSNINKSLVALRNVISALADWSKLARGKKRFVPYRDSVLTWLLKDTLGGNSKTILISTVSPASTCYNETVNTLRFGQRAKQIVAQRLLNEDPKERTIRELRAEIARLRELLLECGAHKPFAVDGTVSEQCATEVNSDSDSGVSSTEHEHSLIASKDEEYAEDDAASNGETEKQTSNIIAIEKLIPLMEFTANMEPPTDTATAKLVKNSRPLQRTFSVDQRAGEQPPKKLFGSHEVLPTAKLRRPSTDKPSLKAVAAAALRRPEVKARVDTTKPKVDSYRSKAAKPRSQVVAAVTQRLYSKVKKKEVATDTLDLQRSQSEQDLSITSKARLRLQELTQKALRAHRRKHAETQTGLFPVMRLKEIATDVDDLQLLSAQVAHCDAATDAVVLLDASTNCALNELIETADKQCGSAMPTRPALVFTRSCGTCTEEEYNISPAMDASALSFTKYLQPHATPTYEIVNPATANPIYTSSVNINVNHNYGSARKATTCDTSETLSEDSLELALSRNQANVCFPTPDLISNHNSLEPHAAHAHQHADGVRFATTSTIIMDDDADSNGGVDAQSADLCVANCLLEESHHSAQASVEMQYAPEMYMRDQCDDDYDLFYKAPPPKYRSNIAHDHLNEPPHASEPTILKSIMKSATTPDAAAAAAASPDDCDSESLHVFDNVPDSLNYYYEKEARKRVHFDAPSNDDDDDDDECASSHRSAHRHDARMFDAMAGFMKEVTTLINNLTKAAGRISEPEERSYDMQIVVNDVDGLVPPAPAPCGHVCRQSESTQTLPSDDELDVDSVHLTNKYEALVEASCERLAQTVRRTTAAATHDAFFDRQHRHLATPDSSCRNMVPEDSSIESQPTFSDYGSLPRRHRHRFASFSSPSSYLRQLTNMRREIVRTSRDELLHEAHMHL